MAKGIPTTRIYRGVGYFVIGRHGLKLVVHDGASGLHPQVRPPHAHRARVDISMPPFPCMCM